MTLLFVFSYTEDDPCKMGSNSNNFHYMIHRYIISWENVSIFQ